MSLKEIARSTGATIERARNESPCEETIIPESNFIIPEMNSQGKIEALLLHGSANGIPQPQLMEMAGCNSLRALRFAVSAERQQGALILSDCNGYFLPSEAEIERISELQAFLKKADAVLRSNRKNTQAARNELRRLLNSDQMSIFPEEVD